MINSEGAQTNKELSPGKRLLQGRLELGLTQEQVAKELYITLVKVKALESDDYRRLTSDTFIRGYIRAYANLLKLDVAEILAAYDQLVQEAEAEAQAATAANVESAAVARPSKSVMQYLLIVVGGLLGLWLISVWFFDADKEKNYTTAMPVDSSVVSSSDAAFESNAEMSSASSELASSSVSKTSSSSAGAVKSRASSSRAAANVANNPRNQSSSAVALSSEAVVSSVAASSVRAVNAAPLSKSTSLDTISFTFSAECWLEVSDSRGDVLATELQGAGSKLTLVGKAPFDVKLGNAPGVDIQLNNKKIDVIPLLGTNVLTLRVGN